MKLRWATKSEATAKRELQAKIKAEKAKSHHEALQAIAHTAQELQAVIEDRTASQPISKLIVRASQPRIAAPIHKNTGKKIHMILSHTSYSSSVDDHPKVVVDDDMDVDAWAAAGAEWVPDEDGIDNEAAKELTDGTAEEEDSIDEDGEGAQINSKRSKRSSGKEKGQTVWNEVAALKQHQPNHRSGKRKSDVHTSPKKQ